MRRIEAVTGLGALREVRDMRDRVGRAAAALRAAPARLPEAVQQLQESRDKLERELASLQRSGVEAMADALLAKAETLGPARVVAANVGYADLTQLRALSDRVREALGSGVVILGGQQAGKPSLFVSVTKDLTHAVNARTVVNDVAPIIDGKGGGRPESASAGGRDPSKLAAAVEAARNMVFERLNGGRG